MLIAACDSNSPPATPTPFVSGPIATLPPLKITVSPTSPPPPTPVSIPHGGLLTIRLSSDLANFNPLINARSEGASWVNGLIFDGLTRLDAAGMAQPDLAEKWDVSPDGLQITFHLRSGVTWHDGQGFSSADVGFTYNVWSKLPTSTRLQSDLTEAGATFSAPDPLTVVVKLQKPFAALLADLSAPIVPAHLLKDVSLDQLGAAPFSFAPVGTGPFKWGQHEPGKNIVLDANPKYFGGAPNLDRVAFLITSSDQVAAAALLDGTLLAGQVGYNQNSDLKSGSVASNTLSFGDYPEDSYFFLAFNLHAGTLFNDYRLRRAFAFALDRDEIVSEATGGEGMSVWSTALPTTWAYEPATPPLSAESAPGATVAHRCGLDGQSQRWDGRARRPSLQREPLRSRRRFAAPRCCATNRPAGGGGRHQCHRGTRRLSILDPGAD